MPVRECQIRSHSCKVSRRDISSQRTIFSSCLVELHFEYVVVPLQQRLYAGSRRNLPFARPASIRISIHEPHHGYICCKAVLPFHCGFAFVEVGDRPWLLVRLHKQNQKACAPIRHVGYCFVLRHVKKLFEMEYLKQASIIRSNMAVFTPHCNTVTGGRLAILLLSN